MYLYMSTLYIHRKSSAKLGTDTTVKKNLGEGRMPPRVENS